MKRTSTWNWIFAALLVLGTATFAAADDHGSNSGKHDDSSTAAASSSTSSSSGSGAVSQPEPGDDHGNQPEPGDDKGGQTAAPDDHGNNDGAQQFEVRRNLKPTMAGVQADASGHVVIRMQGSRQRFQVEAEALVPDGTVLLVFADGNLAGALHMQMGQAELRLDSEDNDLPEGLTPVSAIKMVTVTDANGTVILQAQV